MKRVLYLVSLHQKIIKERVFLTAEQIAGILNVDVIIGKAYNEVVDMACYKNGGCGAYEMYSCSECPASKPEYAYKNEKKYIHKDTLLHLPTYLLVEELEKRAGVKMVQVQPYEDKTISINGPAVIIVVTD